MLLFYSQILCKTDLKTKYRESWIKHEKIGRDICYIYICYLLIIIILYSFTYFKFSFYIFLISDYHKYFTYFKFSFYIFLISVNCVP